MSHSCHRDNINEIRVPSRRVRVGCAVLRAGSVVGVTMVYGGSCHSKAENKNEVTSLLHHCKEIDEL